MTEQAAAHPGPVFSTRRRVRHGHWGLFLLDGVQVREHLDYPCGPLGPVDSEPLVRARIEEAKRAWIERGEIISLSVPVSWEVEPSVVADATPVCPACGFADSAWVGSKAFVYTCGYCCIVPVEPGKEVR